MPCVSENKITLLRKSDVSEKQRHGRVILFHGPRNGPAHEIINCLPMRGDDAE